MTNLGVLKNHLVQGEGYSEELLQVIQSAFDEITASRGKLLELGGYSPADTADLVTGCGKSTHYISRFEHNDPCSRFSTALVNVCVTHQNEYGLIKQLVTLVFRDGVWSAQVIFDDSPAHSSPIKTMDTLSDRLIRLGLATRASDSLRTQLEALWTKN
ncbi:hypothetical protein [Yersinia ruckeri]|uniref:hypothetical protein n=1 Tax=Yersinia ruckeri TaxID=29486 RepID=UPI001F2C6D63|nr:hypothetical protein [Yersinia ruckeri]UIM99504.1 hypothetical protein LGL91_09900 [Yersinia ruckeri]